MNVNERGELATNERGYNTMDEGSGVAINERGRTKMDGKGCTSMDKGGSTTLDEVCGIATEERSGAIVHVGASMDKGISTTEIPCLEEGIFMHGCKSVYG
jgi:hypothetical protein